MPLPAKMKLTFLLPYVGGRISFNPVQIIKNPTFREINITPNYYYDNVNGLDNKKAQPYNRALKGHSLSHRIAQRTHYFTKSYHTFLMRFNILLLLSSLLLSACANSPQNLSHSKEDTAAIELADQENDAQEHDLSTHSDNLDIKNDIVFHEIESSVIKHSDDEADDSDAFFPANSIELEELKKEVGETDEAESNSSVAAKSLTTENDVVVGTPSIWPRIRQGFKLDLTKDNHRTTVQLEWYARNQDYLNRTFIRSERYLHHIVSEAEKRQLPMELALLPVVESAFDPFAYSHGRASGIWQFIPGTGKMYGLSQDWWYDGRRDVVASTDAAYRYLDHLAGRFDGDWQHALASYNSGSGTVSKAIKFNQAKGKPTDFWSLKLPRETRAYVPKLLAIAKIVADPAKYGVTLPFIPDTPQFEIVNAGSQIDLAQAAKLAGIDLNELYMFNPGFNRWATPPLGPHKLAIPLSNSTTFKHELAQLPKDQRVNWQRYKVQSGDSLIRIAKKHHTTPEVIKDVNKLNSNFIRTGNTLLIPVATKSLDAYSLSASTRLEATQSKYAGKPNLAKIDYVVKSGDTLWDLSMKYKVGMRSLAKWNGMAPKDPLKPGQKLVIWSKLPEQKLISSSAELPSSRTMIRKINYRVRSGDSLARIANKFNVQINEIVTWNKINPKTYLQPGQRLTLHVDIASGY